MIKFENTEVVGWEAAIRGMRNPLNSWDKSDSCWGCTNNPEDDSRCDACDNEMCAGGGTYRIGPNDKDLMRRLRNAGTDHRKFMRMITVYVDITAPLYWWKEFDTYKVGTVANSCSTMHKIADKEFTLGDFSHEHLIPPSECGPRDVITVEGYAGYDPGSILSDIIISALNQYRNLYIETKDKKYWWQMIQMLPSSYNQRRTVMLNYEVLANMYKSRKNHKLDEWRGFCEWIKTMPYHELITGFELTTETKKLLNDMAEDIDKGKITVNEARARMGFPPIDMSASPKHTMGMGPIPSDLAHNIGIAPQPSNTINFGPHEKAIVDQIVNDIAKGMGKINLDKYYGGNEE